MDKQLADLLKMYSYHLKVERKLSPNTVAAYCSDCQEFFETAASLTCSELGSGADVSMVDHGSVPGTLANLVSESGESLSVEAVMAEHIVALMQKRSSKISKRSQARFLSSLRSFFDWTILEGLRTDNPCDKVDAPKMGRYLPAVLSVEEVEAIMDSVGLDTVGGVRDRAILEMLYGCGLRVSEACNLLISQVYLNDTGRGDDICSESGSADGGVSAPGSGALADDICSESGLVGCAAPGAGKGSDCAFGDADFGAGFVRVIGKGNKERLVPMGDIAASAFRNWLEVRPEPAAREFEDYAFLNRFGKPLSRVSVFNMVKQQAIIAGIRKEISPHTFRHSFATHMIENGADLRIVQEMLGHESILTTEIYTHIDTSTWQRSILEHHPRKV